MSSPNNTPAILRSLIVYAVSVPLAILVGYLLTSVNNYDVESIGIIGFVMAVLIFPVLMKWHYPWLLFSWSSPFLIFFLPGRPGLFLVMVAASLSISVVERILNSRLRFLSAPQVTWPLVALLGVIVMTAELTGGLGFRSMGSSVYGGKKYALLFIGILSFFALIARPIPKEKAKLYVSLFLLGSALNFIQDLYVVIPAPLRIIYLLFGASGAGMDAMGNADFEMGRTAAAGFAATGGALASLMLMLYTVRGIFMGRKLWRPVVFAGLICMLLLGGQRGPLISFAGLFALLFWLEGLHRSRLMLPFATAGVVGAILIAVFSAHLPYTFQRAIAFLPVEIDIEARRSADDSTEWRLNIWKAVLPQVPEHLLLGTGLAISVETLNETAGRSDIKVIDAANQPLALAHDMHNGPLSIILPFGIWGVLAWLWFWAGGFYVLRRNYIYGDPDLKNYNRYLLAAFVSGCIFFTLIFGVMESIGTFCGFIGLSVALNHGVRGPARQTNPAAVRVARGPLADRPRPVLLPR